MKAIRIGIGLLVAFAVLAHGAVEVWSETVLEIGAAALLVLWALLVMRRREFELRWSRLYLPLGGLCVFALLQLVFRLSFYPYATKVELLKWVAYLVLVFLMLESFRTSGELTGFFWFLLVLGFLVSLFAILQYFTFNGKIYWVRELHEGGNPFGPFVNRNHFAGFAELIVPLGLAMLFHDAVRRDKLPLLVLLTIVPTGALILSASRGGIISFVLELVLLALLIRRHRSGTQQLLLATAVALAAGLMVIWLGAAPVLKRFERSQLTYARRTTMIKDTWHIFLEHPWTGTGLGTLQTVYPRYETYYDGLIVDHSHNDYVELLSDTGVVGGICGAALIGLLFWLGLSNLGVAQSRANRSLYAGSLVACAGMLVHSFVDFNLHISSNALFFLLLAAVAASPLPEPAPDSRRSPRP